jgi:hypothetical protein
MSYGALVSERSVPRVLRSDAAPTLVIGCCTHFAFVVAWMRTESAIGRNRPVGAKTDPHGAPVNCVPVPAIVDPPAVVVTVPSFSTDTAGQVVPQLCMTENAPDDAAAVTKLRFFAVLTPDAFFVSRNEGTSRPTNGCMKTPGSVPTPAEETQSDEISAFVAAMFAVTACNLICEGDPRNRSIG